MAAYRGLRVSELLQQVNHLQDLERLAAHVRRRHQFVLLSVTLPPSRFDAHSDHLETLPILCLR